MTVLLSLSRVAGLCAFALSLGITTTAIAQPSDSDGVVVRAKRDTNEDNKGRELAEISSEEILRENPGSLADTLRGQPGVSVQQTTPGQGSISVHGLSGRAVAHTVDGVPVNSAIFRAGNNPYLGLVDSLSLDSIKVVGGAASVLYGSGALAGAIVMETSTPAYRLEPLTRLSSFQSVSSNPFGVSSHLVASHHDETWAAALNFSVLQYGNVVPGDGHLSPDPMSYTGLSRATDSNYSPRFGAEQFGTSYRFFAGTLVARRRLGNGWHASLRAQLGYRPELVRYDRITPRFKRELPARAEARLKPMFREMISLRVNKYATEAWYDELSAQVYWQRLAEHKVDRKFDEVCLGATLTEESDDCAQFTLTPAGTRNVEENVSDTFGAQFAALMNLNGKAGQARAGLELSRGLVSSHAWKDDVEEITSDQTASRFPSASTLDEGSVYSALEHEWGENWLLSGGVRGAIAYLDITERVDAEGQSESPSFRKLFIDYAAHLGLRWSPLPSLDMSATAARGYRIPNIADFATLGARAKGRFQLPSADVTPEQSRSLDVNLRIDAGALRGSLGAFYLRVGDAIVVVPTTLRGQTHTAEGDRYTMTANASSVEVNGAQGGIELDLTSAVTLYGKWLLMSGTQRNDAGSGLPLETPADRIPPYQLDAGLTVRASDELELESFVEATAAQERLNPVNMDDNRIPEGGTPGFITLSARATYAHSEGNVARLQVNNITNELVLDHGSGFYRPGFSAMLSYLLTTE